MASEASTADTDELENVTALIGRLSVAQRIALLTGRTSWRLPGEPEIGLREIVMSDGPVGVRGELWDERDTSLLLPSPTSLAASWDLDLVAELGRLLGSEARRKSVDVLLAPTVNLHRSPLAGRHFECFSEDPLLSSVIGAAYVRGVQSEGVAATTKHYVANDAETDRQTVDNRVGERALRELYLAPFEHLVAAGTWAVMSAYNSVNGTPMTANPLLHDPLKSDGPAGFGFDGVVISDWFAIYSTVASARAAQDLEMPGPAVHWGSKLEAAVASGEVPIEAVDDKLARLLRLAARVGALATGSPARTPRPTPDDAAARSLLRRAVAGGTVLVRNGAADGRGALLPLDRGRLSRVAVLGPNAATAQVQGGGSAAVYPARVVSILDGLRDALGDGVELRHAVGAFRSDIPEPLDVVNSVDPETGEPGVGVRFLDASSAEVRREHRLSGGLRWPGDSDLAGAARVEVHARLRADVTGRWTIAVGGIGHYQLDVDGRRVIDETIAAQASDVAAAEPYRGHDLDLEAGDSLDLVASVVVGSSSGSLAISLGTRPPRRDARDELAAAVELARTSEIAIVVVGTSSAEESEGFDRTSLSLPGHQDELVQRVAAVNPRTVVVVNAGAPVLLPWREQVAAVLLCWFPGQECGNGLADVLLGVVEPGGRLPTTWPAQLGDVPVLNTTPRDGHLDYVEGIHVGYRAWLRQSAEPAYWFGFGLGYTSWNLAALRSPDAIEAGADLPVTITLTNTGQRTGRQVVQLYLSRAESSVDRPARWLAGFATAEVLAGQTAKCELTVAARAFQHWDSGGWITEPGTFTLTAGFFAADAGLESRVTVA